MFLTTYLSNTKRSFISPKVIVQIVAPQLKMGRMRSWPLGLRKIRGIS